jgi:SH2 domain
MASPGRDSPQQQAKRSLDWSACTIPAETNEADEKGYLGTEPFFYGDLGAIQAEAILQGYDPGFFIMRYSSNGGLAVSVVTGTREVRHTRIERLPTDALRVLSLDGSPREFTSLRALLDSYFRAGTLSRWPVDPVRFLFVF